MNDANDLMRWEEEEKCLESLGKTELVEDIYSNLELETDAGTIIIIYKNWRDLVNWKGGVQGSSLS